MRQDPHSFSESFIAEDFEMSQARARGVELGVVDTGSLTVIAIELFIYAHAVMACSTVVHHVTSSRIPGFIKFSDSRWRISSCSGEYKP